MIAEANRLVEENGGLYVWSRFSGQVAREALVNAVMMRGMGLAFRGAGMIGAKGLNGLQSMGLISQGVNCGIQTIEKSWAELLTTL